MELGIHDIRVIRLVSGETIIGYQSLNTQYLSEEPELDEFITIYHPHKIKMRIHENGDYSIRLYKWLPFVLDNVSLLRRDNILTIAMPDENLINCYISLSSEWEPADDEDDEIGMD